MATKGTIKLVARTSGGNSHQRRVRVRHFDAPDSKDRVLKEAEMQTRSYRESVEQLAPVVPWYDAARRDFNPYQRQFERQVAARLQTHKSLLQRFFSAWSNLFKWLASLRQPIAR